MSELTPIFALSDRFVAEVAALDPYHATRTGVPGFDDRITDYSPDGCAARADHFRATLRELSELTPANDDDRRAGEFLSERLEVMLDLHAAQEWMRPLRPIGSPVTMIRSSFDLMDRQGQAAWSSIATRLELVPRALEGVRAALEAGRAAGIVASQRQAESAAAQCATWAADRWFDSLSLEASQRSDLSPAHVESVRSGAQIAIDAFGAFAHFLRDDYMPDASPVDACGPERYQIASRAMLGATLDPHEMYDWAWNEYSTLRQEILQTVDIIQPGASFAEVRQLLDSDPDRAVHGVDAYLEWLQAMTDDALHRSAEHFVIPERMNRCEAHIAPPGSAAAPYYTSPSEDFHRPGRTWYPTLERTSFAKWIDVTTCYHESVPGHHLQIGYARLQADRLSRYQRGAIVSGHCEGWALYAERLCDELGWFDVPDHRLGFLCAQQLRAVRVIVDIGMHLELRIPEATTLSDGTPFDGGSVWTPDLALAFLLSETGQSEAFLRSEIDRYLGWPAQAISYKIGEREWLSARDDARRRLGAEFDLKSFHTAALSIGPVGLAQLRAELRTAI